MSKHTPGDAATTKDADKLQDKAGNPNVQHLNERLGDVVAGAVSQIFRGTSISSAVVK